MFLAKPIISDLALTEIDNVFRGMGGEEKQILMKIPKLT